MTRIRMWGLSSMRPDAPRKKRRLQLAGCFWRQKLLVELYDLPPLANADDVFRRHPAMKFLSYALACPVAGAFSSRDGLSKRTDAEALFDRPGTPVMGYLQIGRWTRFARIHHGPLS